MTVLLSFIVAIVALGALGSGVFDRESSEQKPPPALVASDPRTKMINVADLRPLYHDAFTTWDRIDTLKEEGKAEVVFLYADDEGNYAYVFDSTTEFRQWSCRLTQPKRPLCESARDMERSRPPNQTITRETKSP